VRARIVKRIIFRPPVDAQKIGNEQNGQENRLFSESLLFLGVLFYKVIKS